MSYNSGIAVHAVNAEGRTWCGRDVPLERRTNVISKIDCKICRQKLKRIRNQKFIAAWKVMTQHVVRQEAG